MSYSAVDRQRFIRWLKKKYGTVGELNNAWAAQRWSRRLNSVEDVHLPLTDGPGPSERYLHLHHYWSDVTVARLEELDAIRQRYAPELPSISNHGTPHRGAGSTISLHINLTCHSARTSFWRLCTTWMTTFRVPWWSGAWRR